MINPFKKFKKSSPCRLIIGNREYCGISIRMDEPKGPLNSRIFYVFQDEEKDNISIEILATDSYIIEWR
jgi:hypothetical protein